MRGRVYNEEINSLYFSHNIIRAFRPRGMKYARHKGDIFIAKSDEER
jgi:hypothetical protein